MPIRRCSPGMRPRSSAARSCCASKTSTRRAVNPNLPTPSSRTCTGWGSTWPEPVWRQSERFADLCRMPPSAAATGPALSLLLLAQRYRRARHRHRSRWRAALCRHLPASEPAPISRAAGARRSGAIPAGHGSAPSRLTGAADLHRRRTDSAATARKSALPGPNAGAMPCCSARTRPTSYHLSVVVDDAAQGVTHVTRGRDMEAATDLHVLLQFCSACPPDLHLSQADPGRRRQQAQQIQGLAEPAQTCARPAGRRHGCAAPSGFLGSLSRTCRRRTASTVAALPPASNGVPKSGAEHGIEPRIDQFHRIVPEIAHLDDFAHDRHDQPHGLEQQPRQRLRRERAPARPSGSPPSSGHG